MVHVPPPKYDPAKYELLARYLDALGKEGWEVAAVHPLVRTESSYFVMKRPATAA